MGSFSIWHWMIVLAVGLLVFGGRGKISDMMGDVAKGIKSFKKGLAEDDADTGTRSDAAMKSIDSQAKASEPVRRADAESKV